MAMSEFLLYYMGVCPFDVVIRSWPWLRILQLSLFIADTFSGNRLNYGQTLISKPLSCGHRFRFQTESFDLEKPLHSGQGRKKMKKIKLDFDKFLYSRHLETLQSSSFSTVSNFYFNQSMAFAGPRKWY